MSTQTLRAVQFGAATTAAGLGAYLHEPIFAGFFAVLAALALVCT